MQTPHRPPRTLPRRPVLLALAATAAGVGLAPLQAATPRRVLREMTEGPFYPPRAWRSGGSDWDADLTRVQRGARSLQARGEHLGLSLTLRNRQGRAVDGCEVEIWQCDALAHYHHPDVPVRAGAWDEGFQGFGAAQTHRDGTVQFRTLRPVPYPGRTPHIHVKLRHPGFGELTSQLFVDGDPGNAGDFLWRRLPEADRPGLAMQLRPAPSAAPGSPGAGLRWVATHELVVPD
ncbi:MAG: intradiol ring-cleavage dioxygenase [Burkholderiaceae bacterium]|nr:intradiol ring-cleavage dioxygenase [Burkholderiaceae bacterium]